MTMPSRRRLLQSGAALAAVARAQQPHTGHNGPLVQIKNAAAPKKVRFFKPAELKLLTALADHIIPPSDTPGASQANVHFYIDWQAHTNPTLAAAIRTDLQWVTAQGFSKKDHAAQVELLTSWMNAQGRPREVFTRFKNLTIDGYYGTQVGLQTELGWNANTFLREFKGCTHPEHQ
jgi:hypothetical protein